MQRERIKFIGVVRVNCSELFFFALKDHVAREHRTQVQRFQTRTIVELREYHSKHFPEEPDRCSGVVCKLNDVIFLLNLCISFTLKKIASE